MTDRNRKNVRGEGFSRRDVLAAVPPTALGLALGTNGALANAAASHVTADLPRRLRSRARIIRVAGGACQLEPLEQRRIKLAVDFLHVVAAPGRLRRNVRSEAGRGNRIGIEPALELAIFGAGRDP